MTSSGVSRDALAVITSSLMEYVVRQDPSACEALFRQLRDILQSCPVGSLADDLQPLPARAGPGGSGGSSAGAGGSAAAVAQLQQPSISLPELSTFLIRVAASTDATAPASTRALAAEVCVCGWVCGVCVCVCVCLAL